MTGVTDPGASPQTPVVDPHPHPREPVPPPPAGDAGPRAAPTFAGLYQAEVRYVWRALWRLGVADRDLEDVAHDVFIVVHRKLSDFDPTRPVRPWLYGICFRIALDRRRKAATTREQLGRTVDVAAVDDADGSGAFGRPPLAPAALHHVEAQHDRSAQRAAVAAALATLPLEQRAVFVLVELEGFAITACVEPLDAPYNTLASRLRLARGAFARAITTLWPESDLP